MAGQLASSYLNRIVPADDEAASYLRVVRAITLAESGLFDDAKIELEPLFDSDDIILRTVAYSYAAWLHLKAGDKPAGARVLVEQVAASIGTYATASAFSFWEIKLADGTSLMYEPPRLSETFVQILDSQKTWKADPEAAAALSLFVLKEAEDAGLTLPVAQRRTLLTHCLAVPFDSDRAYTLISASAESGVGRTVDAVRQALRLALHLAQRVGSTEETYQDPFWLLPRKVGAGSYDCLASLTRTEREAIHADAMALAGRHTSERSAMAFATFYSAVWRDILVNGELWAALEESATIGVTDANAQARLFDRALGLHMRARMDEAARLYEKLLETGEDASVLHNLSLIHANAGRTAKAAELASRAALRAPSNKKFADHAARLAAAHESAEERVRERETFLRTASQRWPRLDYYKRTLMATLALVESFRDWDHLSELTGVEAQYLPTHWKKLVEAGMLVEETDGSWVINAHIRSLVEKEGLHSVATRVIRADDSVAYKPVFNSKNEHTVYDILLGLFPNQLVFPNMGLKAIFQYERMQALLESEEFRYFLMAEVDFCVVSTATYFPIVALELDSPYHELETQRVRDGRKDNIFARGGVPLLRLRPNGRPTRDAMRADIVSAVQGLLADLQQMDAKTSQRVREIDPTILSQPMD